MGGLGVRLIALFSSSLIPFFLSVFALLAMRQAVRLRWDAERARAMQSKRPEARTDRYRALSGKQLGFVATS